MTTLHKVRLYRKSYTDGPWVETDPITLYPSGQIPEDAIFITVKEYEGIRLALESSDPTARLYFDDFETDEVGELAPGGDRILIQNGDTGNAPSPAQYSLRLHTSSGVWETLYTVEPKHYDWSYIHSLRSYLEERVHGMTYNLLKKRSGMWIQDSNKDTHWFTTFRTLQNVFSTLKRQMVLIAEQPLDRIEKVYERSPISTHPDRKSQRWLSNKGQRVNLNSHLPVQFMEKRALLTVDNPENQWVLWFLHEVNLQCKEIHERFGELEFGKRNELQCEKVVHETGVEELAQFRQARYSVALRKRMNDLQQSIRTSVDNMTRLEQELIRYQSTKAEVQQMVAWLSHTLHTGWLTNVTLPRRAYPTVGVRKDPRYGALYRISLLLKDNVQRNSSVRRQAYPYLSTNKLMEVYTVCLLCEMLLQEGWVWEEGWVRGFSKDTTPSFCELRSGEELTFVREDGHQLKLAYDKKIPRSVEEGYVGFETQSNHDMPDILISLFNPSGVFIQAMVVEVKHRNYHYLVHPVLRDQSTDVTEQLKGYAIVSYSCAHRNRNIRDAVARVVCVYPKQDRAPEQEMRYRGLIRLIQIEPSSSPEEKPFGIGYLHEEINGFIERSIGLIVVEK